MTQSEKLSSLRAMLEAFIGGPDRSLTAAGQIEVLLDVSFPDDDEMHDFVICFALYRPGGGDFLYNETQMVAMSKELVALLDERSRRESAQGL